MLTFARLLKIKPTKYKKISSIEETRTLGFRFAVVLGGKLKILSILGFFFCCTFFAQTEVKNSSHIEETKAIEVSYNKGENNYGGFISGIYYYRDNLHFKLFAGFRQFEFKSYSENILESGVEVGLTLWEGYPRGRNRSLSYFNFTPIAGLSYELVKVTSETILIEEYPKHLYFYLGANLEYNLTESIGLNVFFKEHYAVNGSKDELGNWRYDFGIALRYYIFR